MVPAYDVFSYGMNVHFGMLMWGYPVRKDTDISRASDTIMLIDVEGIWPPNPGAGDGARYYLSGPPEISGNPTGWTESYAYRHRHLLNILLFDGHVTSSDDKIETTGPSKFIWAF